MNIAKAAIKARAFLVLTLGLSAIASETPRASRQQAAADLASADSARAVVDRYCVTCHNQRTRTAGLMLDTADLRDVPANAEIWEKVDAHHPSCPSPTRVGPRCAG